MVFRFALLLGAAVAKESSLLALDGKISFIDLQLKDIEDSLNTATDALDGKKITDKPAETGNMDMMIARAGELRAADEAKGDSEAKKLALVKEKIALIKKRNELAQAEGMSVSQAADAAPLDSLKSLGFAAPMQSAE